MAGKLQLKCGNEFEEIIVLVFRNFFEGVVDTSSIELYGWTMKKGDDDEVVEE